MFCPVTPGGSVCLASPFPSFVGRSLIGLLACLGFLLFPAALLAAEAPFVTIWNSGNPGPGNDREIVIYGLGDYEIEWELVDDASVRGSESANDQHTLAFPQPGTYRLSLSGGLRAFRASGPNDFNAKLIDVEQWGDIHWETMEQAFLGAVRLTISAGTATACRLPGKLTRYSQGCDHDQSVCFSGAASGA